MNDLWRLNITDGYDITSFSSGTSTNSANNNFRISFSHDYSDFLTLTPSIGYDQFNPEGGKPSHTYRMNMGGNYEISDVSNAGVVMGAILTDGELGWSATANYDREFEDFSFTSTLTRDVIPSSSGVLRQSI